MIHHPLSFSSFPPLFLLCFIAKFSKGWSAHALQTWSHVSPPIHFATLTRWCPQLNSPELPSPRLRYDFCQAESSGRAAISPHVISQWPPTLLITLSLGGTCHCHSPFSTPHSPGCSPTSMIASSPQTSKWKNLWGSALGCLLTSYFLSHLKYSQNFELSFKFLKLDSCHLPKSILPPVFPVSFLPLTQGRNQSHQCPPSSSSLYRQSIRPH